MRLPRKIEALIRQKEAFLEDIRNGLERSTIRLQSMLFEQTIENIIPRLRVKNGVIEDTAENYKLVSEMEKLFNSFNGKVIDKLVPQISKGIEIVVGLNNSLMLSTFVEDLPSRFEKVSAAAKKITDLRLGLQGGKLVRGGFLSSLMKTDPTELQKFISQSVSSQMTMKEFIKGIKVKINGDENSLGYMERKFQRFAYDTYQQYDAAYNKSVAEEFNMRYFVYSGGLIKDSRDFCAAHNNKVFTTKEAETWTTWTPAEGERNNQYPAGYEIKAKIKTDVPSYLGYPGYDPLVDRGGYNCRHILAYIPEHFAFKYRPELKNGKQEVKVLQEIKEPEFTGAKTIQEAEQRIMGLGVKQASLSGLNIDYANAVLRAVTSESKLGQFSLSKVETFRRSNSLNKALYSPSNNSISINLSKIKPMETQLKDYKVLSYEDQLTRAKNDIQFIKDNYEGNPKFNQNTVYSRINAFNNEIYRLNRKIKAGEVARPHSVSYTFKTGAESMESTIYHELGHYRMDRTFKNKSFSFDEARSISEYGRTNRSEYFAEWYSHYKSYGEKNVPKDLLDIFKSL